MKSRKTGRQAPAFTLVELLVVIGIIGVLAAMILPAVNGARESARRTQCQNNMRQVALAAVQYETQFKKLPPARTRGPNGDLHGFFIHLLPNLEEKTVVDRYNMKAAWNAPANMNPDPATPQQPPPSLITIPALICASVGEERGPITDYSPVIGVHGRVYDAVRGNVRHPSQPPRMSPSLKYEPGIILEFDSRRTAKVIDGMSNTVMFAECGGRPQYHIGGVAPPNAPGGEGRWAAPHSSILVNISAQAPPAGIPNTNNVQPAMMNFINAFGVQQQPGPEIYSFHPGGGNFAFGDGTVRFVTDGISEDALISILTAQDGDVIDSSVLQQ